MEWKKLENEEPEISGESKMFIVSGKLGSGIAWWNKRSGKFLDEPMGFATSGVILWTESPESPMAT